MPRTRAARPRLELLECRDVPSATLVKDIHPGAPSSFPGGSILEVDLFEYAAVGGVLFFAADGGVNGTELWKSDGTSAGTVLVKDINGGSGSSLPRHFMNVNGTLFFSANNGLGGQELWKSDGTSIGTVLVKEINASAGSTPTDLTNVNGTLYFRANDGINGEELWKSDGTAAGTVLVKNIAAGATSSAPTELTNVNGTLFFTADDGTNGTELWKSDGTAVGTVLVEDINPMGGSAGKNFTAVNSTLFFTADDGTTGEELWKSDGTAAGTVLVKDINTGGSASPAELTNFNGVLIFSANNGTNGSELWKSDGTAAGTTLVKDINPGAGSSNAGKLSGFVALGGELFFDASNGTLGTELWKTDGTGAGTVLVADISLGAGSSNPTGIAASNGTLFFAADDGISGNEVWESNGTAAGTRLSQDIVPGAGDSNPYLFVDASGTMFLDATDASRGTELYKALPTDFTGAKVTSAVFSGTLQNTFDKVRITFSESIDAATFTSADIGSFVQPVSGNAIAITGVTVVAGTKNQFDITFPAQTVLGKYSFTTSVNILDLAGNQMNQDGDASNGEDGEDQFTGSAILTDGSVPPFVAVGNFGGTVRILNSDTGTVISTIRPLDNAGKQYTGIVEVALGDFNNDGVPDLLVSAADPVGGNDLSSAKAGKVFIYDGSELATGTVPTSPFRTFTPFATTDGPAGSSGAFTNGLNIATGDVDGDGFADVIAGSRGATGGVGRAEFGRLVVIDGTSPAGSNIVIGSIQKPFGPGYQKGVVVAAGNADGVVGDEIAVTRGGPVASTNPTIQQIKVKVLQLQGGSLVELKLAADGSTSFAPFGSLSGAAKAIKRDGRVAFVDADGDGKDELVFTALDPLTNPSNTRVRVGVYAIDPTATSGAATIVSTGSDAGTYLTGSGVGDHAITHVHAAGAVENLALLTQSNSSGVAYLAPITGAVQPGGFSLSIITGGITIDGI